MEREKEMNSCGKYPTKLSMLQHIKDVYKHLEEHVIKRYDLFPRENGART